MSRFTLALLAISVSALFAGCGTGTIDGGVTAAGSGASSPSSGAAGAAPSPNVGDAASVPSSQTGR